MRNLLVIILFISFFNLEAQFIPHKLIIGFGTNAQIPVSAKIKQGALTTFGNYDLGIGINMFLEYQLNPILSVGFGYDQNGFINTNEDQIIPVSQNPKSMFKHYCLRGTYNFRPPNTKKWNYGLVYTVGLVNHTLTIVDPLKGTTEIPISAEKLSYQESEFSSSLGFVMNYRVSYVFDSYVAATYNFMSAENLLYQDHSFQSIGLNVGLKMKLLRNKLIRYE